MTRRIAAALASLAAASAVAACGSTDPASPSSLTVGRWTVPVTIARDPVSTIGTPRIAAGGPQVAVTWEPEAATDGLRVVRLGADGRWSSPQRVPSLAPASARIGADALGRVVLAWTAFHQDLPGFRCAWAATSTPSGEWMAPRSLACLVNEVGLAVGRSGHALVTWSWSRNNGLSAAPYDPMAGWQDVYALTNGDRIPPSFDAAVDETGLYAIAWDERPEPNDGGSTTLALARGRTLTIVPLTTGLFPSQREPRVAFESPDTAVVTWSGGIGRGVQVARLGTNGGVITAITEDPGDRYPGVAGSGRGASIVSWSRETSARGMFQARGVYAADGAEGRWEPKAIVTEHALSPQRPHMAMDAQGNAVVAWEESGAPGTPHEVWAAVRGAGTRDWAPATRLAVSGTQPAAAIANGVAYVVWVTEAHDMIQEARLRLAP